MSPIARRNAAVFARELARPGCLLYVLLALILMSSLSGNVPVYALALIGAAVGAGLAWSRSTKRRFGNMRLARAWAQVADRSGRLTRELRNAKKRSIADLEDLPRNVVRVRRQLYVSLRTADLMLSEISRSERPGGSPEKPDLVSGDPQAQELYRIADKHLAEYRRRFAELVSSVERTEAQAAVFVSLLDSLRVQLLQHRLGRVSALPDTQEFLEAVTEAKMQLDAIDKTLEELALTPFPKILTYLPDDPVQPSAEVQEDRP